MTRKKFFDVCCKGAFIIYGGEREGSLTQYFCIIFVPKLITCIITVVTTTVT